VGLEGRSREEEVEREEVYDKRVYKSKDKDKKSIKIR